MLIDFSFSNYLSFKESASLSLLVPGKIAEGRARHLLILEEGRYALTPFVGIYGPNAAGKSNVAKALMDFVFLILQSHNLGIDAPIPSYRPFRLDPASRAAPVSFEAEFAIDGIRHSLKVRFDRLSILEEELVFYPEGRRALLYSRKEGAPLSFGGHFRGPKKGIEAFLRKNALFLSTAVNLSNEQLRPVYKYFQTHYQFHLSMESIGRPLMATTNGLRQRGAEYRKLVLGFLNAADISVADLDIRRNETLLKTLALPADMPAEIRSAVMETLSSQAFLGHPVYSGDNSTGVNEYFSLNDEESGGTAKMYELAGEIIDAVAMGGVLVIDEFNSGLHPRLCEHIVGIFRNSASNPKGAQLIVTTHDTNLMARDGIFRDELWLVDRDSRGASELYSLDEFSKDEVRKGANLERWYLDGRFRAIPSLDSSSLDFGSPDAQETT